MMILLISCFQDHPADFPHGIDEFRLNAALIPPPLPLVLLVFLSISLDFFFLNVLLVFPSIFFFWYTAYGILASVIVICRSCA